MPMNKTTKMLQYINHRMRVTTTDGRCLVGDFLAFDRHMNLVLTRTEEYRLIKKKKGEENSELGDVEEKRPLGLVLLRGENVVSLQVESPPQKERVNLPETNAPGVAVSVGNPIIAPAGLGRGMAMPPPGVPPGMNMFQ